MQLNVLEPISFEHVRASAGCRLSGLAQAVQCISLKDAISIDFCLSELIDLQFLREFNDEISKFMGLNVPAIYTFQLKDRSAYPALKVAFDRKPKVLPENSSACSYSRLNGGQHPNALYVGSSRSLATRISQHMGRIGGNGTYAMRLCHWATGLQQQVVLTLWQLAASTSSSELEVLEQQLWDELKPMLGKRSGR